MTTPAPVAASPASSLAAGAANALLGAANTPQSARVGDEGYINERSIINIAPIGMNLGAILEPMMGPPTQGGFGFDYSYFDNIINTGYGSAISTSRAASSNGNNIILIGAAALLFIMALRR